MRPETKFRRIVIAGLCVMAFPFAAGKAAAQGYEYYVVGNPADVAATPTPGLALMGGGADVDAAFQWMTARSGGGDFLVIRASGTDAYNPWIYDMGNVDSVATLVIKTKKAAFNPFVVQTIRNAEVLFLAGGDQSDYVNGWKGTPVEDAIHHVISRNATIGGTSAGLAVLGEFVYTGENGSATSTQTLANPFNRYVTLARDFLVVPGMNGVLTDSHFVERDRMGRFAGFLARLIDDGWASDIRGIAIDAQTAVLVEPDGGATLVGSPGGAAYFIRSAGPPQVCEPKTPLTYRDLPVYKVPLTGRFDLGSWTGQGGIAYSLSAEAGVLVSTGPDGDIY